MNKYRRIKLKDGTTRDEHGQLHHAGKKLGPMSEDRKRKLSESVRRYWEQKRRAA